MNELSYKALPDLHGEMRAFFATGATLEPAFRKARLRGLAAAVRRREADITAALHADLGKPAAEAYLTEIAETLDAAEYYTARVARFSRARRVWPGRTILPAFCTVHPEPFGVALVFSPWNYPFQLSLIPLICAVAAGNCTVLKPSKQSPATGRLLQELVAECFDAGHCRVVLDAPEAPGAPPEQTANALLALPWDFIFYTGSPRVGHLIMESAARHVTPVCLELGGKSPVIVTRDADLAVAARRIAWGKLLNAGQTCVAPDYLLADAAILDELVAAIELEFGHFLGPDALASPDYGRIVSPAAFDRLSGLAARCGVKLRADKERLKIAPVVFKTDLASPALEDEIFGPLLPAIGYASLDDAISYIRANPKPLACYLFTRDKAVERRVLREVSFGGGCINDVALQASSSHLPFGGVGRSGMGRYHGRAGFDLFSNLKGVVRQWPSFDLPLRYPPYGKGRLRWLKRLLGG
ncbi:aldehyde dehydrogenase family protein [Desulfovibrio sp.]|uniref:aldehyde dehydrogenase family protein n=1 Tax=Desulfovibrio sp. TaxID=885 RepID=UPI0025BCB34E|nr:aldehyde dehydrogenase family protein [Desulfovibrio sp.]